MRLAIYYLVILYLSLFILNFVFYWYFDELKILCLICCFLHRITQSCAIKFCASWIKITLIDWGKATKTTKEWVGKYGNREGLVVRVGGKTESAWASDGGGEGSERHG